MQSSWSVPVIVYEDSLGKDIVVLPIKGIVIQQTTVVIVPCTQITIVYAKPSTTSGNFKNEAGNTTNRLARFAHGLNTVGHGLNTV